MSSYLSNVLVVLLFCSFQAAANVIPKITHLVAKVEGQKLKVTYDLEDKDNSHVTVSCWLIGLKGEAYRVNGPTLSGHVGNKVVIGKKRTFTWSYPDTLRSFKNFRLRLVADDLEKADISEIVNNVNTGRLKGYTENVYGIRSYFHDPEKVEKVKKLMGQEFASKGLIVEKQQVPFADMHGHNIIGRLRGADDKPKDILLVAHLDTVEDSPGADDNSSGLAGMLEAMNVLSNYNFKHSIQFVAFDVEEQGLVGSTYYTKKVGQEASIMAVVNYDMIGFYSDQPNSQLFPEEMKQVFPSAYEKVSANGFKGDFALGIANEASQELLKGFERHSADHAPSFNVVTLVVPDNGRIAPEAFRASDHVPFWDAGIPAISIGDTADARNQNYHGVGDTLETLDYDRMGQVVKATVALIADMAGVEHSHRCEISITNSL